MDLKIEKSMILKIFEENNLSKKNQQLELIFKPNQEVPPSKRSIIN